MVYSIALRYVKQEEEAEEITQDVFVKVYFFLEKFENRSSLKTWIYRICVNACLEFLKKKKRKKRFGFNIPLFNEESGEENAGEVLDQNALEKLESKETQVVLETLIDNLPENQRTAFILLKLNDLSYKEIAEIMETSESAVDSLLSRARANLKKELEKIYPSRRKNK